MIVCDPVFWSPVRTAARGHSGTVYVSTDAVKRAGVRVNVTAAEAQQIADSFGALLNTSRTADLAYEQAAVPIPPCLQRPDFDARRAALTGGGDPGMSSPEAEQLHSRDVDAQIGNRPGLARDVGKDWIIHPRMSSKVAINYGWRDLRAPNVSWSGQRMWQTIGTRHNLQHKDYSQTLTLLREDMQVDGAERSVREVLADPVLADLVSDDGVMHVTRYPVPHPPIPKVATPLGELELAAILRDAHHAEFGEHPSPTRLGVAWSQCMLEHARGAAIYCHNIGNVSGFGGWAGDVYVIRVKEQNKPGVWEWVDMRFRAHADFLDGAADYWAVLHDRFTSALPLFDAGEPVKAAAELRARGYFTANLLPYARGMQRLYVEFNARILPRL